MNLSILKHYFQIHGTQFSRHKPPKIKSKRKMLTDFSFQKERVATQRFFSKYILLSQLRTTHDQNTFYFFLLRTTQSLQTYIHL